MRNQSAKFLRFATVGVAVALSYIGLYLGFLSLGMAQLPANGLAFFLAILLQYAGQAMFTFGKPLIQSGQILRFSIMVGFGFVTSAIITGPIAQLVVAPDWIAALAVTLLLPVQNFIFLTLWVFATPSLRTDLQT